MIYMLLLCFLIFLIYISDRKNPTNRWGGISGFLFCLGAIKEYFYFDLVPLIPHGTVNGEPLEIYTHLYSVMTALLYCFAMPTAIIFAMYFAGYDPNSSTRSRNKMIWGGIFFIPLIILLFYKPHLFRSYQLGNSVFWYVLGTFNLLCGLVFSLLILRTVFQEPNPNLRRQKRLVATIILPPVIYWLVTIFIIHPLKLNALFKLWQGNIVIVILSIGFFLVMSFRDGIMGLKLRREKYRWNSDMSSVRRSVAFTIHMFKNETAKMEYCIDNLEQEFLSKNQESVPPTEFALMRRSIEKQQEILERARRHSDEIILLEQPCSITNLIEEAVSSISYLNPQITIRVDFKDDASLLCDKAHILETIINLLRNAAEAISLRGEIRISYDFVPKKGYGFIQIADNGSGIEKKDLDRIFDPYYTTENPEKNFGLGLAYCRNVIQKHGGYIKVQSTPNKGSIMTIALPSERFSLESFSTREEMAAIE
ncbi:hypothetical protein FRZ06_19360 [Anoxybacterium hadale]|uniref:Uncharacterized protein n=1 Tax=Anoxybacterium hadale TaxID=3408580 RepID=A0ACD1AGC3_9FIRM|nr:hypothetical protein FRZ06_19360 [Clostridiales bacterium]